jgi:hypothetical protein
MIWHCWEFLGASVDIPPVCEYRFFFWRFAVWSFCLVTFLSTHCVMRTCQCLPMAHVAIMLVRDLTLRYFVLLLQGCLCHWRIVSPPKRMEAVTHKRTGDENLQESQTKTLSQLSSLLPTALPG